MLRSDSANVNDLRHTAYVANDHRHISNMRKRKTPLAPSIINGDSIEIMDCFYVLSTIISSEFGWENNTDAIVR